jgi:hypothetical protein
VRADGTIAPPGTVVPRRPHATASPTVLALPQALYAEPPRRRDARD